LPNTVNTFDQVKRIIYKFAPPSVFAATLIALYFEYANGTMDTEDYFSLPAVSVWCLAFTYVSYRKPNFLRTFEIATFAFLCLHHLFRFYFIVHGEFGAGHHDLNEYTFWIPFFYICGFLILDKTKALRVTLAVFTVTVFMGAYRFWRETSDFVVILDVVLQFYISNVVYIVALYFLYYAIEANVQSEEYRRMAFTDFLTRLPNRRQLEEWLAADIDTAHERRMPLSVALVDIDRFKRINDAWGHDTGDAVLVRFGAFLSRRIRDGDAVGRWGGEEFLIVLRRTGLGDAAAFAERLRAELEQEPFPEAGRVTASFGLAQLGDGETLFDLLKRADQALYASKSEGRNRITTL